LSVFVALLASLCSPARADVLDVSGSLRGVSLGKRIELLEDRTGTLTVEQVARAGGFVRSGEDIPNFGFTKSAYWLRVRVKNVRSQERAWLLELGYPMLDDVTLFTPRTDGGFEARRTGDAFPFAQRDIAYRNFVFSLHEPASSARTYYLRVRSSGAMSLPLTAWSLREFVEHQHLDWTALCIFYGVLLIMSLYSLLVYAVTKQREYIPYAGYVVSMSVFQFTVAGHTFQFVPVSVLCALCCAGVVARSCFPRDHRMQPYAGRIAAGLALAVVPALLAPYAIVMPLVTATALLLLFVVAGVTSSLARVHSKEARLFLVGWSGAILGGSCAALVALGVLPVTLLSKWSIQIGVTIQLVMLSSAYADKYNGARLELAAMQQRLSQKVQDLSAALARAEQASERARQATRLKNEFMATMSHEFRTPLNPIINIPQGVRQEFSAIARAVCDACGAHFELDEGDQLDATTVCPECARVGTLSPRTGYRFSGDAARAKALIGKVEHSGRHLLTVVNGILDFSKMQAGHLKLTRERSSVGKLFKELERAMREQAEQRRVILQLELPDGELAIDADPLRTLQALSCLVDNAIKYSDPGSMVTVRAVRAGMSCSFSVKDHGIGIARENLERIFESFEQVHKGNTRKYGGTGLGLAIARSLVRMHDGDVRVQSEVGQGSTFSFELPLAQADPRVRSA
jgi:signal transduction histidine kinase